VRRPRPEIRGGLQRKKYMSIVLKEVKRLERILDERSPIPRKRSPLRNFHDLNRLLEEILLTMENEFRERNILVVKDFRPGLPSLFCEPQQIKQVFINLFFNAMQAMGQNGRLTLKTSREQQGEKEFIQIEVTDTGGGIQAQSWTIFSTLSLRQNSKEPSPGPFHRPQDHPQTRNHPRDPTIRAWGNFPDPVPRGLLKA